MATLPRRDLKDLASLAGESDDTRPEVGREAAVTTALRAMPQAVRPGARFTAGLRERLLRQAHEAGQEGNTAVPTPVRPE